MEQKQILLYGEIPTILRESKDQQCIGSLCRYSIIKRQWTFCALGTVYHSFGEPKWKIIFGSDHSKKLREQLHIPKGIKIQCPKCGARCGFFQLIIHLNDKHYFSYNEIADRLQIAKDYDSNNSFLRKVFDTLKSI